MKSTSLPQDGSHKMTEDLRRSSWSSPPGPIPSPPNRGSSENLDPIQGRSRLKGNAKRATILVLVAIIIFCSIFIFSYHIELNRTHLRSEPAHVLGEQRGPSRPTNRNIPEHMSHIAAEQTALFVIEHMPK